MVFGLLPFGALASWSHDTLQVTSLSQPQVCPAPSPSQLFVTVFPELLGLQQGSRLGQSSQDRDPSGCVVCVGKSLLDRPCILPLHGCCEGGHRELFLTPLYSRQLLPPL